MDSDVDARVRLAPSQVVSGGSLCSLKTADPGAIGASVMRTSGGATHRRGELGHYAAGTVTTPVGDSDNVHVSLARAPQASPGSRCGGSSNAKRFGAAEERLDCLLAPSFSSSHNPYESSAAAAAAAAAAAGVTGVRGRGKSTVLQRLAFFPSQVYRLLHRLRFVKDENVKDASSMLECACAAVGVLWILLFLSLAALVGVVLVVRIAVRDGQRHVEKVAGQHLDLCSHGRSGATCSTSAHLAGIGRVLDGEGLKLFAEESRRAAEWRQRLQRNASLWAELRSTRGGGDTDRRGVVNLPKVAQTLPELEHLSLLLHEVSEHVRAIHEHDPVMGLVELSNFLLHAKGRREALETAAERARAEAASAVTGTDGGAPVSGDSVAKWAAALMESFVGHSEAARLRAQLRGFIRVSAHQTERVTEQPFDDLAMLQYRHAWMRSEVLPMIRDRSLRARDRGAQVGDANAAVPPDIVSTAHHQDTSSRRSSEALMARDLANRMAVKADLYDVASIFNHIYYYPLHRYSVCCSYSSETVADTDAWYSAIAAVVQTRFGAPVTLNKVQEGEDASLPLTQRDSPLSSLALSPLGSRRVEEVGHLYTPEDRLLMPAALSSTHPVNTYSIFVSVASYRDVECAPTLLGLFRNARNPHRIHVGVVQQNRAGDIPCLLPEMYTPYLCPAEDLPGFSAENRAAGARESRARERTLYSKVLGSERLSPSSRFDARVCFLADQVRVREIDAHQAKGPTYGRYMAMLLYRGEDVTLILDSHNRFRPMWDTLGATMLRRMEDPKAVLSHYPEVHQSDTAEGNPYRTTTVYLCRARFLKDYGYLRLDGIVIASAAEYTSRNMYNDPYVSVKSSQIDQAHNFRLPQPWVAGGFLLSYATIFRDVPFDPHLSYIFDGEEVLYSVRLWTHGYNIYSPPRGLCFHMYGRSSAPKIWNDSPLWYRIQSRARARVQFLLRAHTPGSPTVMVPANTTNSFALIDSSRYGMGTQRTVDEWYKYAGADPIKNKVDGRWCGVDPAT